MIMRRIAKLKSVTCYNTSGPPPISSSPGSGACGRPVPNSDTGGEFAGGSGCGLEGGKARDACLGNWGASEPLRDPDEVDGSGRDDVLEVYLGQADVTGATEAAATNGLRVRTLNTGAGGIAGPERLGLLVPTCSLQRLKVFASLQADDAWLTLGAGARGMACSPAA